MANCDGSVSTKVRMLAVVDDIDLITRQLFETLSNESTKSGSDATAATTDSQFSMDVGQLTDLLLHKNKELDGLTATAREQQQLMWEIEKARAELHQVDAKIACLHKHFKAAESLLATALYHAKDKLKTFDRASQAAVHSEDVIKYAHKISASCSTAAPLNWTPGDPRRPYPQDVEMRCGWLGQCNNLAAGGDGMLLKPPAQLGTDGIQLVRNKSTAFDQQQQQPGGGVVGSWQDSVVESAAGKLDEAEVMSSDSTSSESSDSSFGND